MRPPRGKISVIQLLLLVFLVVSAAAAAYQIYYLPHFAPRSAREFRPVLFRDEPIEVARPVIRGRIENRSEVESQPRDTAKTESAPPQSSTNPVLALPGLLADAAENLVAGLALRTKDLSSLLDKKPEPEIIEPSADEPDEADFPEPLEPDGFPTEITELGPLATAIPETSPADSPPTATDLSSSPSDSPSETPDSPPVSTDTPTESADRKPSGQIDPKAVDQTLYVVQVRSTPSREEANRTMAKLGQTPYTIYSYPIEISGKIQFRVRAGFFKTYEEAKRAADRIATMAADLPKPWVTPVAPKEFAEHHRGALE